MELEAIVNQEKLLTERRTVLRPTAEALDYVFVRVTQPTPPPFEIVKNALYPVPNRGGKNPWPLWTHQKREQHQEGRSVNESSRPETCRR